MAAAEGRRPRALEVIIDDSDASVTAATERIAEIRSALFDLRTSVGAPRHSPAESIRRIDGLLDAMSELGRAYAGRADATADVVEGLRARVKELEAARERLVADKLSLATAMAGGGGDAGGDEAVALRALIEERDAALAASRQAAAEVSERLVDSEEARATLSERVVAAERRVAQLDSERAALETALMSARDRAVLSGGGRPRESDERTRQLEEALGAARAAHAEVRAALEARIVACEGLEAAVEAAQTEARQAQDDLIAAVAALDDMEAQADEARQERDRLAAALEAAGGSASGGDAAEALRGRTRERDAARAEVAALAREVEALGGALDAQRDAGARAAPTPDEEVALALELAAAAEAERDALAERLAVAEAEQAALRERLEVAERFAAAEAVRTAASVEGALTGRRPRPGPPADDEGELTRDERVRLKLEIENLRKRLAAEGGDASARARIEAELASERRMRTALEARFGELRERAAEADAVAARALELEARVRELEAAAERDQNSESDRAALAEALREARRRAVELELRLAEVIDGQAPRHGPSRPATMELVAPPRDAPVRPRDAGDGGDEGEVAGTMEFAAVAYEATRSFVGWDESDERGDADAQGPAPRPLARAGTRPRTPVVVEAGRATRKGRRPASTLELRARDYVTRDPKAGEALGEVLAAFPKHLEALRDADAHGDAGSIERRAALLHAQFQEVGALRLAGIASHLELAGSAGETSEVPALIAALDEEFGRVEATLREVADGALGLVDPGSSAPE